MESIGLEPVDAVTVTTLVDNVTDLLLGDEGPATVDAEAAAPLPRHVPILREARVGGGVASASAHAQLSFRFKNPSKTFSLA